MIRGLTVQVFCSHSYVKQAKDKKKKISCAHIIENATLKNTTICHYNVDFFDFWSSALNSLLQKDSIRLCSYPPLFNLPPPPPPPLAPPFSYFNLLDYGLKDAIPDNQRTRRPVVPEPQPRSRVRSRPLSPPITGKLQVFNLSVYVFGKILTINPSVCLSVRLIAYLPIYIHNSICLSFSVCSSFLRILKSF